jgi:hypothetical protein
MRAQTHLLFRYLVVFVVILTGVIAFSMCAESPVDACVLACCGGADSARPLGRVARWLSRARSWVASAWSSSVAVGMRQPQAQVASTFCAPTLLAASSLRI